MTLRDATPQANGRSESVRTTDDRPGCPCAAPGGRRILIVEDNRDAADSLREALELLGHDVRVTYDGCQGLAAALADPPDAVVCDIGLPGLDGYQVARALREDDRTRGLYLLALTGYALPEDIRRAADAGFDRHMAKPPDLDTLERVLASPTPAGSPPAVAS